jgi:hypothetical protein
MPHGPPRPDRVRARCRAHVIIAMYSFADERAFDPMHESAVFAWSSVHDGGGAHSVEAGRLLARRWP